MSATLNFSVIIHMHYFIAILLDLSAKSFKKCQQKTQLKTDCYHHQIPKL